MCIWGSLWPETHLRWGTTTRIDCTSSICSWRRCSISRSSPTLSVGSSPSYYKSGDFTQNHLVMSVMGILRQSLQNPDHDEDEHNDGEKHVQNVIVTRVNAVVLPLTNGCAIATSS